MRKLNRVECSTVSVAPALAISLALVLCAIVTMAQEPDEAVRMIDSMQELPVGLGSLPEIKFPTDNPETAIKVELGQRLFFEKRLSGNGSMSCATCHDPQHGFQTEEPGLLVPTVMCWPGTRPRFLTPHTIPINSGMGVPARWSNKWSNPLSPTKK